LFNFIAEGKRSGKLEEEDLSELLDKYIGQKFDPKGENNLWDFGSWVDALNNAGLLYDSIDVNEHGEGKLVFQQTAWPCGGLQASEEIVKIFGGTIVSNNGE